MGYIDAQGNYYEGDRQGNDQEVSQRPEVEYIWASGAWIVDISIVKATKLAEIKQKLAATDYKCWKYIDGALSADEYAATKTERTNLRTAYNTIEAATMLDAVKAVSY